MTMEFITIIILLLVIISGSLYLITLQRNLIYDYQKVLEDYHNHVNGDDDNTLLIYCLQHIMEISADKDDFETAKKCRDLLTQLTKKQNGKFSTKV